MKSPINVSARFSICLCLVVLGGGASMLGCGAKKDGESSAKPEASSSAKSSPKASSGASSGKATVPPATDSSAVIEGKAEKKVDIDHLLDKADDGHGDRSGLLAVDMSGVDDSEAPALGGAGRVVPPKPVAGSTVSWMDVGLVSIPNPGWKEKDLNATRVLSSPDGKVAFIFNRFTTDQDGTDKANKFITAMKLTDTTWKKPKKVKVGKDSLPGILGSGHAKVGAKGVKVIYLLAKTGGPENLMVVGVADDDATKEDAETVGNIISNIRKK